jgi:hypothetical protein
MCIKSGWNSAEMGEERRRWNESRMPRIAVLNESRLKLLTCDMHLPLSSSILYPTTISYRYVRFIPRKKGTKHRKILVQNDRFFKAQKEAKSEVLFTFMLYFLFIFFIWRNYQDLLFPFSNFFITEKWYKICCCSGSRWGMESNLNIKSIEEAFEEQVI